MDIGYPRVLELSNHENDLFLPEAHGLILYHIMQDINNQGKKPIENIVGKGENYGFQDSLLFPCFLL